MPWNNLALMLSNFGVETEIKVIADKESYEKASDYTFYTCDPVIYQCVRELWQSG